MRKLLLVALLALASCDTEFAVPETSPNAPITQQKSSVTRTAAQGVEAYRRVAQRVEPVAEQVCRQQNPSAPRIFCDFRIAVDNNTKQPPNAFQSRERSGRPVITFNINMLRTVRNDDEIAFILGHEAGHQIANHLTKQRNSANLGGLAAGLAASVLGASDAAIREAANLGGTVGARAFSKDLELEADVLGTYISEAAGYDPRRGATSFARFSGGSNAFLASHPPSGQRLATVNAVATRIESERARGQVPVIRRN
ncbi:MAG: M48 family metalloprotease [Pseudomonadota bacterium]